MAVHPPKRNRDRPELSVQARGAKWRPCPGRSHFSEDGVHLTFRCLAQIDFFMSLKLFSSSARRNPVKRVLCSPDKQINAKREMKRAAFASRQSGSCFCVEVPRSPHVCIRGCEFGLCEMSWSLKKKSKIMDHNR